MELFRLFGSVLIDDKDAIASLRSVDNKGKSTSTGLSNIAKKGALIGTAIVAGTGVAIGGLLSLADSTSDTAAKWLELSQRTDIGVESLQKWGYAARQSGADVGKLEVGMKKLSTSIVDAKGGSEKAVEAYTALGISMTDLATMSPEQTFDAVMKKLADMPESAEKNVAGNQLLGKSYTELKPLLDAGSEGMEALKNRADELGIVMSEKGVVSAESYGDTMDDLKLSFEGIKNKIMVELMPKLMEMGEWFVAKMPEIKEKASTAFTAISTAIKFIGDNANIIIPILSGLVAGFVAMKVIGVISGLMAIYTAFTTTATGVQIGLNAAMMANPIGLVILAIVALIAIGVALYMNWDKVKATCIKAFGKVKEVVSDAMDKVKSIMNGIINFVKKNWAGLLLLIANPFAGAFKLAYDNCTGFRTAVDKIFNGIKTSISNIINGIKTTIATVFGAMLQVMTHPFDTAKTVIKTVLDKIKGFFNFSWEFPKLKMPHFSVTGSMNPLDWVEDGVPKIGVKWYKNGGIFNKPTIFNTPYGAKGVGEAGAEVVAPISDLAKMISDGVASAMAPFMGSKASSNANPIQLVVNLDGKVIFDNVYKEFNTRKQSDNGLSMA